MTKDELIQTYLKDGLVVVDAEAGTIYSTRTDRGKPLKGYVNKDGYISHHFLYHGTHFKVLAHRVVWVSQHGPVPHGMEIDHKNRVRNDNRIANLRVTTHRGNSENRVQGEIRRACGESHHKAKLTVLQVLEMRELYKGGMSRDKLASLYGLGQSTVSGIVRGESWKSCLPPNR